MKWIPLLIVVGIQSVGNAQAPTKKASTPLTSVVRKDGNRLYRDNVDLAKAKGGEYLNRLFYPETVSSSRLQNLGRFTKVMGIESLQFVIAQTMSAYLRCLVTSDPTICNQFIDSLKDPTFHIGFLAAAGSSRATALGLRKFSPALGNFMGMAVGFFVNNLFNEFYYDMKVMDVAQLKEKYLTGQMAMDKLMEGAAYVLPGLFAHFLIGKSPAAIDQVAKGFLSASQKLRAAGQIEKAERLADITKSLIRGRRLVQHYNTVKAIKFVVKNRRIVGMNPFYMAAGLLVEDGLIQLYSRKFDGLVTYNWGHFTRENRLALEINDLMAPGHGFPFDGPESFVLKPGLLADPTALEKQVLSIQKLWEDNRKIDMNYALEVYQRHQSESKSVDIALNHVTSTYLWFVNGAKKSHLAVDEDGQMAPVSQYDQDDLVESLFCNSLWSHDPVQKPIYVAGGWTVPFFNKIKVKGYGVDLSKAPQQVKDIFRQGCHPSIDDVPWQGEKPNEVLERRRMMGQFRRKLIGKLVDFGSEVDRVLYHVPERVTAKDLAEGKVKWALPAPFQKDLPFFSLRNELTRAHEKTRESVSDAAATFRQDYYGRIQEGLNKAFLFGKPLSAVGDGKGFVSQGFRALARGWLPAIEQEKEFWYQLYSKYKSTSVEDIFLKASYAAHNKGTVGHETYRFLVSPPTHEKIKEMLLKGRPTPEKRELIEDVFADNAPNEIKDVQLVTRELEDMLLIQEGSKQE